MELKIKITRADIKVVQSVCSLQKNTSIYQNRLAKNIRSKNLDITKEIIWKNLVYCLLSTQQRSSEDSNISKFLKHGYSTITFSNLEIKNDIETYIRSELINFGGIRRNNKIAEQAAFIYAYLNSKEFGLLEVLKGYLEIRGNRIKERELANSIVEDENLKGIGPKQSRNFLQLLGCTQFEIPIDSRITAWLNEHKIFPFKIGAKALSDNNLYEFVNDVIIELCVISEVKPCLFDAAVFSLKEKTVK